MSKTFLSIKCWTARSKSGNPYKVCINSSKWKNKKKQTNMSADLRKSEQNLINDGFQPKVVRKVLSKMKQYKRPSYAYSKTTGKLKQSFKTK